jgi:hypothetical protein
VVDSVGLRSVRRRSFQDVRTRMPRRARRVAADEPIELSLTRMIPATPVEVFDARRGSDLHTSSVAIDSYQSSANGVNHLAASVCLRPGRGVGTGQIVGQTKRLGRSTVTEHRSGFAQQWRRPPDTLNAAGDCLRVQTRIPAAGDAQYWRIPLQ